MTGVNLLPDHSHETISYYRNTVCSHILSHILSKAHNQVRCNSTLIYRITLFMIFDELMENRPMLHSMKIISSKAVSEQEQSGQQYPSSDISCKANKANKNCPNAKANSACIEVDYPQEPVACSL